MCIRDSLIAALQTVNPRLGQRAQAALSAFTRVSLETAVTFLINDIINSIAHDTTLTLVLDCLLYTSDAADERSSVDLGGRRIIKKKTQNKKKKKK